MRGSDERTGCLFSFVDLEARVRQDHPLRTIRKIANAALGDLSRDFSRLYTDFGRPGIAPEKLLRAMLLQAFYGVRSERQLMERMEFDLLFRWFVGLGVDDPVWDHSTFSKNRDRLLEGKIAAKFLSAILAQPRVKQLLSSDHFSVDGTLIEAWASIKSFRKKDGGDQDGEGSGRNAERNFHNEKRSNQTHESTTDPEARLYKKGAGQPAKLCYMGHVLMENRHGLAVGGVVSKATGTAERDEALQLIDRHRSRRKRRITLGADKAYDVAAFVQELRGRAVTPHIAIDGHLSTTGKPRRTAIDRRTLRQAGYAVSQRCRKRIEEVVKAVPTRSRPLSLILAKPAEALIQPNTRTGCLQPDPPAKAIDGVAMSVWGKWRVVKTPGYDMAKPASYIMFDEDGGKFALDCLTGSIHGSCDGNAIEFEWDGNNEMDEATGEGWAQLQPNGDLEGEIRLQNGDDIPFIARK